MRTALLVAGLAALASPALAQGRVEAGLAGLRFPNRVHVQVHKNQHLNMVSVNFETKLAYPSEDVVRFYDRELRGRGWIPFNQPGIRQWDCFEDSMVENPLVHQFGATWVNLATRRMALVVLRYESRGQKGPG